MSNLVIAEHDGAEIKPHTLNTIAAAKAAGGDIHVAVIGCPGDCETGRWVQRGFRPGQYLR